MTRKVIVKWRHDLECFCAYTYPGMQTGYGTSPAEAVGNLIKMNEKIFNIVVEEEAKL
jgi:hypothetical protein